MCDVPSDLKCAENATKPPKNTNFSKIDGSAHLPFDAEQVHYAVDPPIFHKLTFFRGLTAVWGCSVGPVLRWSELRSQENSLKHVLRMTFGTSGGARQRPG